MRSPLVASFVFAWVAAVASSVIADEPSIMRTTPEMFQAPQTYPAPGFEAEGCEALFFDGETYQGKPTKVFAWIGMPQAESGEKLAPKSVPGIVLVHGGGGTAFDAWVRLWTRRGYAAIAMDTTGTTPRGTYGKWERHDAGGPGGNDVDKIDLPLGDQWQYHAVASVIRAHSLLRSRPEVDPERIGLTGISWGGYLTCLTAGLDDRFKFAVPVYGTGFLGEESLLADKLKSVGGQGVKWMATWDPQHYLKTARMPFLWVTGTNDFAFTLDSLERSIDATPGVSTKCVRIRMPHGHNGPGENPDEIRVFADSILKDKNAHPPLPAFASFERDGRRLRIAYKAKTEVVRAEVCYTKDVGRWTTKNWESVAATVNHAEMRCEADLPEGATHFFVNLVDKEGRVVSSRLVDAQADGSPAAAGKAQAGE